MPAAAASAAFPTVSALGPSEHKSTNYISLFATVACFARPCTVVTTIEQKATAFSVQQSCASCFETDVSDVVGIETRVCGFLSVSFDPTSAV